MKTRKKKNNELERKEQSMPRLNNTSNFLNASHLLEVLHKLKEAGVNTMGQKLRGYRLLSAVRGQNTLLPKLGPAYLSKEYSLQVQMKSL